MIVKAGSFSTCKTLFSRFSITKSTNVSGSYFENHNRIIDSNSLIMDIKNTTIYEFWGFEYWDITIPDTVKTICSNAFENSTITQIKFGANSDLFSIEDKDCF